ncbi:MAG: ATP synthase F0 subunit B [Desulfobacteraceae bacterium]|jgi:F-type H+-transporting ATPase subunit b
MKSRGTPVKGIIICVLLAGVFWCGMVWAADAVESSQAGSGGFFTRATWDLFMRWVNFLILAGLIVKYGREPLAKFLKGQQADTARSIQRMEDKKRAAEEKIREGQSRLQDSKAQLERISERIVSEGQRRKTQMIEDAKLESRMMLETARARIDQQVQDAYRKIRGELIEAAVEKAMVKLPKMITQEDNERMIDLWMEEAMR